MTQSIMVNLFGVNKEEIHEVGEYLKNGLSKICDVWHCYNTITNIAPSKIFMMYDHTLEWLIDYNGIVDIIINESPLASFAFYGETELTDKQYEQILTSVKNFNNYNIIILPASGIFEENSQLDKMIKFLHTNGINGLFISNTQTHRDQLVKDLEDIVLPEPINTDTESN